MSRGLTSHVSKRSTSSCSVAENSDPSSKGWTDEQVATLKHLRLNERLSFSEIAARIPGKSRSACLAKAHRLGLCGDVVPKATRAKRARRAPGRRVQPAADPVRPKLWPVAALFAASPVDADIPGDEEPAPPDTRKTLQELTDKCCRWPIGDPLRPGFHFCGQPKVLGLPYCAAHARKAYQAPQPRRSFSESDREEAIRRASERVRETETV